jgi:hypothetical protein
MSSDCSYPDLTAKQKEITTGLLMGDGWINGRGTKNNRLATRMISQNYLEYLDNIFGVFGCGVALSVTAAESAKDAKNRGFSPNAKEENYSDVYRWQTRAHPKFNEFREWYSTGKKVWPENIELTPTVLKHWYVGDGTYVNNELDNYIAISMCNEIKNTEKVSQYFTDVGLPNPSFTKLKRESGRKMCKARWSKSDTNVIFEYMGEPLPDFEYKWPEEYQ